MFREEFRLKGWSRDEVLDRLPDVGDPHRTWPNFVVVKRRLDQDYDAWSWVTMWDAYVEYAPLGPYQMDNNLNVFRKPIIK